MNTHEKTIWDAANEIRKYLQNHPNETEILEFLETIQESATELGDEITAHEIRIDELENEIDEADPDFNTTIETPMGVISYSVEGSIDLQTRMEQLAQELYNKYTQSTPAQMRNRRKLEA